MISSHLPATRLYTQVICKLLHGISKRFNFNLGVHVFGGDDTSMTKQIPNIFLRTLAVLAKVAFPQLSLDEFS